jgi:hypothetical protein
LLKPKTKNEKIIFSVLNDKNAKKITPYVLKIFTVKKKFSQINFFAIIIQSINSKTNFKKFRKIK